MVLQCLQHRGPDEQASLQEGNVVLYHTRLAIQDIQSGRQPMQLGNELTIVFNGEIYNHQELRKKYNLQCHTQSDTETMLLLYKQMGIDFLHELDGMFAFSLFDKTKNAVWLVRDRAGKKPLYYHHYQDEWFFASELNTIKAVKNLEIEYDHFYEFMRLGSFYQSHTPYKNVHELPGGSWLKIDLNTHTAEQQKWWDIKPFYQKTISLTESEAIAQAASFLDMGVKRRLESSDLEVGCFLSGGIDSSLVATTAAQHTNKLKTFTVAFSGRYNEAPLAKLVADQIQSHHTEINIDFSDLQDNIEQILANYGEPFTDSSAIPTWYVSREARKHVKVILNGDGADELFGGYRRYVPFAKYDFFNTTAMVQGIAKSINGLLPVSHNKMSLYNYIYRLTGLAKKDSLDVYLAAGTDIIEGLSHHIFTHYKPAYFQEIGDGIESMIANVEGGLKKLMLVDFNISLFSALLVKMDIGSMAHALEGRSPFLCKEFLEWAPTLPDEFKIKGKKTKYLLRQLAKNKIPAQLVNQPKRGFEIPLKQWVEGDLKEIIHSYLFSAQPFSENFVKKTFVQDVWERKLRIGDEKRAKILWMLFSLEVWHKKIYLSS